MLQWYSFPKNNNMPNWCYTTYKLTGPKESIEPFYEMLKELQDMKEPYVENGFGNLWLGCIVNRLGGDWNKISCRGDVTYYGINDDGTELTMDCEIAWAESPEFRHFLEDKLSGVRIVHRSEEPGLAGYWTNDPDCEEYYLDSDTEVDIEPMWYDSLEEVAAVLNNGGIKCEPTKESIYAAIDKYEEENPDSFLTLREVEFIDD